MTRFDAIRFALCGPPGRLAVLLGFTTAIALVSASLAPTAAHADQITFGFSFGQGADLDDEDAFLPPLRQRDVYQDERPRYLYPSRHAPRIDMAEEIETDTVCHLIPVRVLRHGRYVIRDIERCREVPRW